MTHEDFTHLFLFVFGANGEDKLESRSLTFSGGV